MGCSLSQNDYIYLMGGRTSSTSDSPSYYHDSVEKLFVGDMNEVFNGGSTWTTLSDTWHKLTNIYGMQGKVPHLHFLDPLISLRLFSSCHFAIAEIIIYERNKE